MVYVNNKTNYENQNNRMKSYKILIFIIFIISICVTTIVTYNFIKNKKPQLEVSVEDNDKGENIDKTDDENYIEPEKNNNYTFKKSTTYTIPINGKKTNFTTYYYVDSEEINHSDVKTMYVLRSEIFINNNRIDEPFTIFMDSNEVSLDNYLKKPKDFTNDISYLKDSKTGDKYMIIPLESIYNGQYWKKIYIVNGEGKVLSNFISRDFESSILSVSVDENKAKERKATCKDGKCFLYTDNHWFELQDDKLFYLEVSKQSEYYDEYMITIENGNLSNNLIGSYFHEDVNLFD